MDADARVRLPARIVRRLRRLPGRWLLLASCLLLVVVVIAFQGVVTHTIGASAEAPPPSRGAMPLLGSRPIMQVHDGRLVSYQPPPGRRVALTFDDGPDPRWTPRIAKVLHDAHVPGAFFVVGSKAARYPGLVRQLASDGDEIGNHTFTHTALSSGPAWQRRAQLDFTEAVIVGITGHYARFVRPPYSATMDAITNAQQSELAHAIGRRYYVALADYDSEDWKHGGVQTIVRRASPPGASGGIVLFHDGGGDRSQTVAAVAELIPRLRARGFRFVSLAELAGLPTAVVTPAAPWSQRARGVIYLWAVRLAFWTTDAFTLLLLAIAVLVGGRTMLLLTLASHQTRTTRRREPGDPYLPPVAVIMPAYNEHVGIGRAVLSLAASDYPDFEIVVVDDGSTDATAAIVSALGLSSVHLVRQDNAGKAAALNAGIGASTAPVVVMVDADTVFESDTLRRLVQPLADPCVGAASGNTKVGNRGGLLGRWQHIEYVIGFNLDRRMYEVLQCTPTVPGAVGAFRREVLDAVGGVPGDTLAEDTDLTLAIERTGSRVVYVEDARAWTEAPSTMRGLWRQRYRWSFGTMQAVWKHRGAVLSRDPRERRIGRRALPYIFCFQILLPIAAPLIDVFALYGIIFTDPLRIIVVWLAFNSVQLVVAFFGFRWDREPLAPLWAMPLQQFAYRQLMYVVIIEATISALIGRRASWKPIPRTGDIPAGVETAAAET